MNLTLVIKLAPTPAQYTALLATMERFNAACDAIAAVAFEHRTANKVRLQHLVYHDIRARFGLSAQLTIRAIAKVCEAYTHDKSKQPTFRPHGAIVYDQRILSWKGLDRVSLFTLDGRQFIPIILGGYQAGRLSRLRGQADLLYRDGTFYLAVVVDAPEPIVETPRDFLGMDLGVINLATTSEGETFSGEAIERTRQRYHCHRQALQKAATGGKRRGKRPKNIRRALRRTKRREARFRRAQRAQMSGWAFSQLRQFVTYKAALLGVALVLVDPRNTSRTCSECGHCDKANRTSQAEFCCRQCQFSCHADLNAALNIRARALVNAPQGAGTAADDSAA